MFIIRIIGDRIMRKRSDNILIRHSCIAINAWMGDRMQISFEFAFNCFADFVIAARLKEFSRRLSKCRIFSSGLKICLSLGCC